MQCPSYVAVPMSTLPLDHNEALGFILLLLRRHLHSMTAGLEPVDNGNLYSNSRTLGDSIMTRLSDSSSSSYDDIVDCVTVGLAGWNCAMSSDCVATGEAGGEAAIAGEAVPLLPPAPPARLRRTFMLKLPICVEKKPQ